MQHASYIAELHYKTARKIKSDKNRTNVCQLHSSSSSSSFKAYSVKKS